MSSGSERRASTVGRFDGDDDPPVAVLVETLERALGRDAATLPPLYESLDPDGIETLFGDRPPAPDRRHLEVRFRYLDRTVTVRGDGVVRVDRR